MTTVEYKKTLDEYLDLPYRIVLTPDEDDEGNVGYVAEVLELPGCLSQGATREQALHNIGDAMRGWLSVALEDGVPIPEPRANKDFSGRFLVRLPQTLHADLARHAEYEGVSLNQFIATALAGFLAAETDLMRSLRVLTEHFDELQSLIRERLDELPERIDQAARSIKDRHTRV